LLVPQKKKKLDCQSWARARGGGELDKSKACRFTALWGKKGGDAIQREIRLSLERRRFENKSLPKRQYELRVKKRRLPSKKKKKRNSSNICPANRRGEKGTKRGKKKKMTGSLRQKTISRTKV